MEISIPEEKSEFKVIGKDGKEKTWEISLIREIERGKDGTKRELEGVQRVRRHPLRLLPHRRDGEADAFARLLPR